MTELNKKNKFVLFGALFFALGLFLFAAPGKVSATSGWTNHVDTGGRNWMGIAYSSDGTKLAGVVSGGYVYTSTDSGETWVARTSLGQKNWVSIASSSDGTKLSATTTDYIYTSTDSGVSWTQRTVAGDRYWFAIASSSDGSKIFAVTESGYIYTSTDGGVNWTERTSAGSRRWRKIASSSDGTKLVAVVENGYIYTSTDGGVNWTERTSAGSRHWYAAASSSDGTKLVVSGFSGSYIFVSSDSGATWTQTTNLDYYWTKLASSADGSKLIASSDSGYLFVSSDSGATWTQQTSAGRRYWFGVSSSADGTQLAAASYYIWIYGNLSPSQNPLLFSNRIDCCNGYYTNVSTVSSDFNNDGKPDIARTGSVMLGNGDGTFQNMLNEDFGSGRHVIAADFNNDGKSDVAGANYSDPGYVYISLGNGDGTFQTKVGYAATAYTDALAYGDFNNDGKKDLVTTSYYSNAVSVYIGNGDGTFQTKVDYATGGDAFREIGVSDFNNDGKQDLAVVSPESNNKLSILLGNGDGTFQTKVDYATGIGSRSITIGDLNSDGKMDIVTGNYTANSISVFLGNGDGTFQTKVDYAVGANPLSLINLDINGDDILDLIVANASSGNISILLGNGNGTFQTKLNYDVDPSMDPDRIIASDFNNDGLPDLLVSSAGYYINFSVLLHLKIILTPAQGLSVSEGGATDTYTVALAKQPTSDVVVTINPNSQLLTDKSTLTFTTSNWNTPQVVTVSAVNDDVYQGTRTRTINHTASSLDSIYNGATGSVSVAITDNDFTALVSKSRVHLSEGGSSASYTVQLVTQPTDDVVIALDHDPSVSLDTESLTFTSSNWNTPQTVTVSADDNSIIEGSRTVSVTHTSSSADPDYDGITIPSLDVFITDAIQTNLFLPKSNISLDPYQSYRSSVTNDFNGDGKQDLAIAANNLSKISVMLGNGDGTFQTKVDYDTGNSPFSVTTSDFNGDGKQDLVTANVNDYTVSVLLGNGDGTFQTKVDYLTGYGPNSIVSADFNDDGKQDLATSNIYGNTISVLFGNGDGTFQTKVDYNSGSYPYILVAADFNGDDVTDLAATDFYGSALSIFINNGDGTFQTKVNYATGGYPHSVTVGDFNGDGLTDLATPNTGYPYSFSILLSNGDGTFQTKMDHLIPYSDLISSGDFNNDGIIDLITKDDSNSNMCVFIGNGDGTFQTVVKYSVNGNPQSFATGDFNDDGLLDIAVTASDLNNLSILLASPITFYQRSVPSSVSEYGSTDAYAVALKKQPASDVIVTISPDSQLITDKSSLSFSTLNWNTPQLVTVSAVDDSVAGGTRTQFISHTSTSSDPIFNNINLQDGLEINIGDNDPGVVINAASSLNVVEDNDQDSYQVKLSTQPTDDVVITIIPEDPLITDYQTLTFTSSNWDTYQSVYVSAPDDNIFNGDRVRTITHTTSSNDPDYDNLSGIPEVTVNIHDVEGYLASDLLGQLDDDGNPVFSRSDYDNNEGVYNPRGLDYPDGAVLDSINHRIFVVDYDNSRVLGFNLDTSNNLLDRTADYVLGQPDFATADCNTSQAGLCYPYGDLAFDSDRQLLFVTDYDNSRVVVYDVRAENSSDKTLCGTTTNGIANGMLASCVIGQVDFDSSNNDTTQTSLSYPYAVSYDSTRQLLFVADSSNNRVLTYDFRDENSPDKTLCGTTTNGIANGMPASCVIGQTDFDSSNSDTTQTSLSSPYGVSYDPVRQVLFVSDYGNYRVLAYDIRDENSSGETLCGTTTQGIASGMPASCVIGQVDFTSYNYDTSSSTFEGVYGINYDPDTKQLFVADSGNYRVLIFDTTSLSNNPQAIGVLGQPNMNTYFSGTSRSRLESATYMAFDPIRNRLYLTDDSDNRVLIYDFVSVTTPSLIDGLAGSTYNQTLETTNSQGTVTFAVTSGSLPSGLSLDSDTGVISGTPTSGGDYSFTIVASDTMSFGTFKSQPETYSVTVIAPPSGGGGPAPGSPPPLVFPPTVILPPNPEEPTPPTPTPPTDNTQTPNQDTPGTVNIPPNVLTNFFITPKTLIAGTSGQNIKTLQQILNELGFSVSTQGPGSPGHETTYFGPLTKKALILFQEAHSNEILKPLGLKHGTGILGPYTLKFLKSLLGY